MISSILFIIGLAFFIWSLILLLKEIVKIVNFYVNNTRGKFDFSICWLFSLIGLSLMFYHLGIIFK